VTFEELGLVQAVKVRLLPRCAKLILHLTARTMMRKLRRPKPFCASKEAKRLARLKAGAPPPSQVLPDEKRKPPKHKKRNLDLESL
jgi:hypothetical protein